MKSLLSKFHTYWTVGLSTYEMTTFYLTLAALFVVCPLQILFFPA